MSDETKHDAPCRVNRGGETCNCRASFGDKIAELAQEKYAEVLANRERYVTAWIAETGLAPSESMLVEQRHADGRTTVTVTRREGPESDAPAMLDLLRRFEWVEDGDGCPECGGYKGRHNKCALAALLDKHGRSP